MHLNCALACLRAGPALEQLVTIVQQACRIYPQHPLGTIVWAKVRSAAPRCTVLTTVSQCWWNALPCSPCSATLRSCPASAPGQGLFGAWIIAVRWKYQTCS